LRPGGAFAWVSFAFSAKFHFKARHETALPAARMLDKPDRTPVSPVNRPDEAECWVLTTGETGMRSQVIGLAEATGLSFAEKRIRLRAPWSWLPGNLCPLPLAGLDPAHDLLRPPWPRLLISCGRRSTAASIAVRKRSRGATMTVHIQDPQASPSAFDLVIPMRHDGLTGPNVFPVDTALHHISSDALTTGRQAWQGCLKPDNRQLLGVVLGGANRHYRFDADTVADLMALIRNARARDWSVVVTPSRRTEPAVIAALKREFGDQDWFNLWDGSGDNPYVGILALADRLIVTGESVSMVSEALATGHPVHILPLAGRGRRHGLFIANLADREMVSLISGGELDWDWQGCQPVDSTPLAAEQIRQRLAPA
jgi:mitochondrial fission protein ELM1